MLLAEWISGLFQSGIGGQLQLPEEGHTFKLKNTRYIFRAAELTANEDEDENGRGWMKWGKSNQILKGQGKGERGTEQSIGARTADCWNHGKGRTLDRMGNNCTTLNGEWLDDWMETEPNRRGENWNGAGERGEERRERVKGRERGQRRERNTDRGCNGAAEKWGEDRGGEGRAADGLAIWEWRNGDGGMQLWNA